MDKFILAENPMRSGRPRLWVVHLLDPVAIIECHKGVHLEKAGKIYKFYQFRNKDNVVEEWTLTIYHLFTTDFLEEPEQRALPLLDRAWRWFRAYLEWEDQQIINDE